MADQEFELYKRSVALSQIALLKAIVAGKYGRDSRLMGCLDMLEAKVESERKALHGSEDR